MRSRVLKNAMVPATLLLTLFTSGVTSSSQRALPNPVLVFMGQEPHEVQGKQVARYKFAIDNREVYPNEMFAPSPALPPCGTNTKAARTWVDLYDQNGKRLLGFCALRTNEDLSKLWFALPEGETPPSWVYVELNDRQTNTKYKSNLAETTL
jgi:hypothetical protein